MKYKTKVPYGTNILNLQKASKITLGEIEQGHLDVDTVWSLVLGLREVLKENVKLKKRIENSSERILIL